MKLQFSEYLSSKMREEVRLQVFPSGKPEDYLTERTDQQGGESESTTYEYDFPDNTVVIAELESGGPIIDPDESTNLLLEVHIGPEADEAVVADARAVAQKLADEAGISENDPSGTPGLEFIPGLQFINH